MTRDELAQALGVAPKTIQRWEAHLHRPHPIYVLRMEAMAAGQHVPERIVEAFTEALTDDGKEPGQ